MQGFFSREFNPAFNLATEEYLLRKKKDDVFFLYINDPSIIVGKHQNTLAEIDYDYILKNDIPVYRRLSGGGTVYHDHGNLNFCFITNEKQGELINFDKHSTPIVKALESLGLKVKIGTRHDLSINDKKITGTASHVYKNRAMHHGTLLYSADLTVLNKCLNGDYKRFKSKGVKSVRSTVTNISEHLRQKMSMDQFTSYIFNYLLSYFENEIPYKLSNDEISDINELITEKYGTWEWNFGYSPVYEIERSTEINGSEIKSHLKVEKGFIREISIVSLNNTYQNEIDKISGVLKNVQHSKPVIQRTIPHNSLLSHENLLKLLF